MLKKKIPGKHVLFLLGFALCFLSATNSYAACTSPAGAEGKILYNQDFHVPQYCDGTDWISMGGVAPAAGGGSSFVTDTTSSSSNMTVDCGAGGQIIRCGWGEDNTNLNLAKESAVEALSGADGTGEPCGWSAYGAQSYSVNPSSFEGALIALCEN